MTPLARIAGSIVLLSVSQLRTFAQEPAAAADAPAAVVLESVELDDREFGGPLEGALKIETVKGTFRLSRPVTHVMLRIDFYSDGEKVKSVSTGHMTTPELASAEGRFALHIIDLDYLRLGDGPSGHCRFHATLQYDELKSTAKTEWDIPKAVFDRSRGGAVQAFRPRDDVPSEAPIFYVLGHHAEGTLSTHGGGETPEEVQKDNPKADIAAVVLEFGDREH